ncbi:hypothetical protein ACFX13_022934 [Malus domestica]
MSTSSSHPLNSSSSSPKASVLSVQKLQGKVAVVTSGVSGIGEATTQKFTLHGARAMVITDVQDDKGQNVVASIGPDHSIYIHYDVTDEDQVKFLVESTVKIYGRLDVTFQRRH